MCIRIIIRELAKYDYTCTLMTLEEIQRTHSNSSTPSTELLLCPMTLSPPAPSPSPEGSSGSLPVEPHWSTAAAAGHQALSSWTPADRKSV